eukprot:g2217.t1
MKKEVKKEQRRQRVCILGGTGMFGIAMAHAARRANLDTVIVSRQRSALNRERLATLSNIGCEIRFVLSLSQTELTEAMKGCSILIVLLPRKADTIRKTSLTVYAAAVDAGIQRFVPDEFGCDTKSMTRGSEGELFDAKKEIQEELLERGPIPWTIIYPGVISDFALPNVHWTPEAVTLYGDLDMAFQTHALCDISDITIKAATDPRCANKCVFMDSPGNRITQRNALTLLRDAWPHLPQLADSETTIHFTADHILKRCHELNNCDSQNEANKIANGSPIRREDSYIMHNLPGQSTKERWETNRACFIRGFVNFAPTVGHFLGCSELWPNHQYLTPKELLSRPEFVFGPDYGDLGVFVGGQYFPRRHVCTHSKVSSEFLGKQHTQHTINCFLMLHQIGEVGLHSVPIHNPGDKVHVAWHEQVLPATVTGFDPLTKQYEITWPEENDEDGDDVNGHKDGPEVSFHDASEIFVGLEGLSVAEKSKFWLRRAGIIPDLTKNNLNEKRKKESSNERQILSEKSEEKGLSSFERHRHKIEKRGKWAFEEALPPDDTKNGNKMTNDLNSRENAEDISTMEIEAAEKAKIAKVKAEHAARVQHVWKAAKVAAIAEKLNDLNHQHAEASAEALHAAVEARVAAADKILAEKIAVNTHKAEAAAAAYREWKDAIGTINEKPLAVLQNKAEIAAAEAVKAKEEMEEAQKTSDAEHDALRTAKETKLEVEVSTKAHKLKRASSANIVGPKKLEYLGVKHAAAMADAEHAAILARVAEAERDFALKKAHAKECATAASDAKAAWNAARGQVSAEELALLAEKHSKDQAEAERAASDAKMAGDILNAERDAKTKDDIAKQKADAAKKAHYAWKTGASFANPEENKQLSAENVIASEAAKTAAIVARAAEAKRVHVRADTEASIKSAIAAKAHHHWITARGVLEVSRVNKLRKESERARKAAKEAAVVAEETKLLSDVEEIVADKTKKASDLAKAAAKAREVYKNAKENELTSLSAKRLLQHMKDEKKSSLEEARKAAVEARVAEADRVAAQKATVAKGKARIALKAHNKVKAAKAHDFTEEGEMEELEKHHTVASEEAEKALIDAEAAKAHSHAERHALEIAAHCTQKAERASNALRAWRMARGLLSARKVSMLFKRHTEAKRAAEEALKRAEDAEMKRVKAKKDAIDKHNENNNDGEDLYVCNFDCGFVGNYDAVAEHELSCTLRDHSDHDEKDENDEEGSGLGKEESPLIKVPVKDLDISEPVDWSAAVNATTSGKQRKQNYKADSTHLKKEEKTPEFEATVNKKTKKEALKKNIEAELNMERGKPERKHHHRIRKKESWTFEQVNVNENKEEKKEENDHVHLKRLTKRIVSRRGHI